MLQNAVRGSSQARATPYVISTGGFDLRRSHQGLFVYPTAVLDRLSLLGVRNYATIPS